MISASSAMMCGFLDDATAAELYGPADAITCGAFAPIGRATPVAGGHRVSGRWPFASNCEAAQWRMGGAMVEGGAPRSFLFRASETRIHDTWDASGLRGTSSHDIEVSDVFVPEARSYPLLGAQPKQAGDIFRVPLFGLLAASVAAVTIGIARASIEAFVALAKVKQAPGAKRPIAQRETVQLDVARAEAGLRASRAFLHQAMAAALDDVRKNGAPGLETRAGVRLAAAHAASECAKAVDRMYEAAGATSIYARHPLQRHFRDVHVATQHVMVGPIASTLCGRLLLGLESDVSLL
jgi:alkylation response protein AidB-like acyl-CoA dehydrogenase